jgi:L-ascorbate metabolism protein UlaG (beta-lactamase superfamily)
MFDRDATLWCGYVLLHPKGNIYFAGDTGYGPIFTPIGEQYGPMRPGDPAHRRLQARVVHVAHPRLAGPGRANPPRRAGHAEHCEPLRHLQLADDGKNEPAEDLRQALRTHNLPESAFIIPEEGKGIDI